MAAGALAVSLFGYRYYVDHVLNWDLLAVGLTFVAVKLTVLLWHRWKD